LTLDNFLCNFDNPYYLQLLFSDSTFGRGVGAQLSLVSRSVHQIYDVDLAGEKNLNVFRIFT